MRRFIATIAICFATSAISYAQVSTAAYNFSGLTPTQSFTTTNTSLSDSTVYVNPGSTVVANGLTTAQQVSLNNALDYKGWSNASAASTTFYSFNLTAATTINLQTLTINAFISQAGNGAGNSHGPTSIDLAYATAPGGPFATLGTVTTTPNTTATYTFNFSSSTLGTSNLTAGSTVYFELLGYNASNNGNGEFGLQSATGVNGISVPIFAPVPEPTSIIALSCIGLSALGFKLRRKKVAAV